MLQLSRLHMYAATFTPLSLRRIDAVILTPHQWCRRSDAAAFMQHPARRCIFRCQPHAAAFTPSHLRCRSRTAAFTLQALEGAICRWKRTTRSAFSNAERDAGGRELARAGAGRGGAGRSGGGAGFERVVLGWGGGRFMYVHIPKRVCDGGVKNRGWGWKSGQKRPDLGKKRPHRAIVRKACKIALEWGQKKSIIVVVASAQLDILRQKVSPVAGSGFCVRSDGAPEATVNPTNLTCSVYSDVLLFMDQ